MTLTVTDNQGGTNTSTQQVTVSAVKTIAADSFARTVSKGWDSADTGGVYTVVGAKTLLSVSGGYGQMTLGAGNAPTAYLNDVSAGDLNWVTDVTTNAAATGSGVSAILIARSTANGSYRLKLRLLPNGVVNLAISRTAASGAETVIREVTLPGLTYTTGDLLRVRFTVSGTSPTTLTGTVWKAGTTRTRLSPSERHRLDGRHSGSRLSRHPVRAGEQCHDDARERDVQAVHDQRELIRRDRPRRRDARNRFCGGASRRC